MHQQLHDMTQRITKKRSTEVIEYDGKLWETCEEPTNMVFRRKWETVGKIVGRRDPGNDTIRIEYVSGKHKWSELSYDYFHKRHEITYIKPWINQRLEYLKSLGVEWLVHFTPIENLPSIMRIGFDPAIS